MMISTSRQLDRAMADPAKAARDGVVTLRTEAVVPSQTLALSQGAVAGGLKQVTFNLTYSPDDPEALKAAVGQLEGLTKVLAERAQAATPPEPVSLGKVGAAAGVGAVTGLGIGVVLTEMGKLGAQSGNPFLSAAALACGLLGAAAGAGVGTGVVHIDFDKFGVKARTT